MLFNKIMILPIQLPSVRHTVNRIHPRTLHRSFASQTLLSRTDFENKTAHELKEELRQRGLATASKKKSVLIKTLLEDERRKAELLLKETLFRTRAISTGKNSTSSNSDDRPSPVISSPAPVVARVVSEVNSDIPVIPKIQTESHASVLASPVTNLKSEIYEAKTWPASIILPITPEDQPVGTAIPFIPDNYDSHLQSHAPQLTEVKSSSAGLNFSTASHPSTLPGGGPILAAVNTPKSNLVSKQSSDSLGISNVLVQLQSYRLTSLDFKSIIEPDQEKFQFEDRPLGSEEQKGLYRLFGLISGGWILAGLVKKSTN